jgi:uncharacterized protein (TIGR03000 family)
VNPAVNPAANRINPNHPPGWDWWRTYPWSRYNAWRNPYWYPPYNWRYPYPYPVIVPFSYDSGIAPVSYYDAAPASPVAAPTAAQDTTPVPQATGELQVPPANGAIIQLRGLEPFAPVLFNGQEVSSVGSRRFYVTSDFTPGRRYAYTITTTVTRDGQPTSAERTIEVLAGNNVIVDFSQAGSTTAAR